MEDLGWVCLCDGVVSDQYQLPLFFNSVRAASRERAFVRFVKLRP